MREFSNVRILKWIDGDTVDLEIDLGFGVIKRERCRLWGVNAPEMKGETFAKARDAQLFMEKITVECGSLVVARTHKDRDKYGRYLAELIGTDYANNPRNFGEELIRAGLAVEFMR